MSFYSNFTGYGSLILGAATNKNLNVLNTLTLKCADATPAYQQIGQFITGANYRLEVSRAGNIKPYSNGLGDLGDNTHYFNAAYIENIEAKNVLSIPATGFANMVAGTLYLPLSDVAGTADSQGKVYWDDPNQDLIIYSTTTGAWEKVHLA